MAAQHEAAVEEKRRIERAERDEQARIQLLMSGARPRTISEVLAAAAGLIG